MPTSRATYLASPKTRTYLLPTSAFFGLKAKFKVVILGFDCNALPLFPVKRPPKTRQLHNYGALADVHFCARCSESFPVPA
jgi:hypothetical protein